jgi:hypothetical protein
VFQIVVEFECQPRRRASNGACDEAGLGYAN